MVKKRPGELEEKGAIPEAAWAHCELDALCQQLDYYEIAHDDERRWLKLTRELASDWELRYPRRRRRIGRPKKHTVAYLFCVRVYVEYKRRIDGIKSDMKACRQLVRAGCFELELRGTHEQLAETLRGQLRESRKDIGVDDAVRRMEIDWDDPEDVYRAVGIAFSNRADTHGRCSPLP